MSTIDIAILTVIKEEYQVLINIPKNNSTIRDNTGAVYIQGTIEPIFKRGLTI